MVGRSVAVILLILSHLSVSGETIEEVMAAVGNTPILRSDLYLASAVRLIEPQQDEAESAYTARLLKTRINLELQFRDLEESGTLFRLDLDVAKNRAHLASHAGGEEALLPRLEAEGLTVEDLDELSLRMASATAYIEQRLRPRIRVTSEEIQTTYHDLVVRKMEAAGTPPPPLADVQGEVRQLLVEQKLNNEIERWLESAAEQHEVTLFYRP